MGRGRKVLDCHGTSRLCLCCGGSLDDLIEARLGGPPPTAAFPAADAHVEAELSRSTRIRLHRAHQKEQASGGNSARAVHYFSAEEVRSLFVDVASGLAFLVSLPSGVQNDCKPLRASMNAQYCT